MDKVTAVRIPKALREDADFLVEAGYYKSISEMIVSGLRREMESHKHAKVEVIGKKIAKKVGKRLLSRYLERRAARGKMAGKTSRELMNALDEHKH